MSKPWTCVELKILRDVYLREGANAATNALPGRSLAAVYNQAAKYSLVSPVCRSSVRLQSRWTPSPFVDERIRALYAQSPQKDTLHTLSRQTGYPHWWLKKRALALGVAKLRRKEPPWSEAEIELLAEVGHLCLDRQAKRFRAHGFCRTATAIAVMRKRRGYAVADSDILSATGLARALGVDGKTVTRWISRGWLAATRKGTDRLAVQGGDIWQIRPADARRFIVEYTAHVPIERANKFWLVDLLSGDHRRKGGREAPDREDVA